MMSLMDQSLVAVEVFDGWWNPLGRIEKVIQVKSVRRVCDESTGSLDCVATPANRALLVQSNKVQVSNADGRVVAHGKLVEVGESGLGAEAVCKVSWQDTLHDVAQEVASPNPSTVTGQGTKEFDRRKGFATTVITGFVDDNVGPAARDERRIPGLAVGGDRSQGVYLTAPVSARWDNLLELIRSIAIPNAVIFDVQVRDRTLVFDVRGMRDLTNDVVFTAAMLRAGGSWRWVEPEATRILALGPGDGTKQMVFMVSSVASRAQEAVWGRSVYVHESGEITVDEDAQAVADAAYDVARAWDDNMQTAWRELDKRQGTLDSALGRLDKEVADAGRPAGMVSAFLSAAAIVDDIRDAQVAVLETDIDPETEAKTHDAAKADVALEQVRHVIEDAPGVNGAVTALTGKFTAVADANAAGVAAITALNNLKAQWAVVKSSRSAQASKWVLSVQADADLEAATLALTRDVLEAECQALLAEKGESAQVQYEVSDISGLGIDWDLGDIVSAELDGLGRVVCPVREITETWGRGGYTAVPVLGDYQATSSTGASIKTRQLVRVIDALKRKK